MPRSQPVKEVPRWKRGTPKQPLVRQVTPPARGDNSPGQAGQPGQGNRAVPPVPSRGSRVRRHAWRNRRLSPPLFLAVFVIAGGLALHRGPHHDLTGWLACAAVPGLLVWLTRHLSTFARRWFDFAALLAGVWLPQIAVSGLGHVARVLFLLTWLPLAWFWVKHYKVIPVPAAEEKQPEPEPDPSGDPARWQRLTEKRKWTGHLVNPVTIPGGRKWDIMLDGSQTNIGEVLGQPRAVAAAYDKAMTDAYVEPHRTGVESRGTLTILKSGTLQAAHEWNGQGFSSEGIARLARFADGAPVRIRAWIPRDGTRHGLIAGASGAGKSATLDLLVWLAVTAELPVIPVILDPQNGQSLPQWRGRVLYASGVDECARMMRGLNAGLMDRSLRLSSMTWDDEGHPAAGMPFFDSRLSGLPVLMPIVDEAPLLLQGEGNAKLAAEMVYLAATGAKLARKAGGSMWFVAQLPSLAELGDQALRSQLVGGNVISLRTGDSVSSGMLGLEADPSALPKYFPDGSPTQGIGYAVTMDNRQAPMRVDMVPSRMRHEPVEVPQLEPEFLEAMDRAMGGVSPTSAVLPAASPRPVPITTTVEPEPMADDGPEGRTCADAVLQVLTDRGTEMERGEVIKWVGELATTGWGRPKPFGIRSITNALRDLTESGLLVKPRDGVYKRAEAAETITKENG